VNYLDVEAKDSRELMPAEADADGVEDKIACAEESAWAKNFSVCENSFRRETPHCFFKPIFKS
jgi:hypothetical protein